MPRSDAMEAAAGTAWAAPATRTAGTLVAYSSGDELRLAWRVMVNASSTGHFDTLVDAARPARSSAG